MEKQDIIKNIQQARREVAARRAELHCQNCPWRPASDEELPTGPDTTENIQEVVDDPELMDVEAGWYARRNIDDKPYPSREEMMNRINNDIYMIPHEETELEMKKKEETYRTFEKFLKQKYGPNSSVHGEDKSYLNIQPEGTVVNPCVECPVDTCPSNPQSKFITSIDETPGDGDETLEKKFEHFIGAVQDPENWKCLDEDYDFSYDGLLRKMQDTHARKNSDYGDAAYKGYKKYGDYYFLVQLNNKLSRLESLTIGNKKQQVLDESIDDTLMDMANYAIMYLESRHRHD